MPQRPLTPGEIVLAKTVFGASVDYQAVRLHDRRILPPGFQRRHQAVARGNHISFPRSAYAADFSVETDPLKQSVFIHELTHVWQHQNKIVNTPVAALRETLKHAFNYAKCYLHALAPGKDLVDYGFEQQAAIVQDYFLLSRHGIARSFKGRRTEGENDPALKTRYEKTLARFLADPAYAPAFKKERCRHGKPESGRPGAG